jgi:hypothetical protein
MQNAGDQGIREAFAGRPGKKEEHAYAHETHQGLYEKQRQKPVQLEFDQQIPAGVHEGCRQNGKKNIKFQLFNSGNQAPIP